MASATVPLLDDDTIPFGEEDEVNARNSGKLTHPYVTFFHLFFRCSSIVVYMLCGWFSDSFITSFVCVVLLLSADFWTVKNITGRLLVGLRWWNYVDDEGVSHWVYEARKGMIQGRVNQRESKIFWLALVLCPVVWAVFFIIALFGFKFKWLLLVLIALALNGANLHGYIKCNFGASKDLGSVTTEFFKAKLLQNAVSFMNKPAQPSTAQPTGIV
ncbi:uncharacterized Golgi apparatus membrane protein-like protein CG5021 isoform X1 [Ctenocephalides felis]|uniref:uncharacterized Golgi apparatus membrane protein-like protein CG5021 isoform X1 n=1 Tax=Ctenocephalides felis TaxID=7515 RepID=UPI000E6E3DDB|nr:uncharacterized Golgi apparatus membrane protein-like protein CG5021 isoform X1 [Ctenocephalides felis]XP_026480993.1 uncharacterized Golgi apparatus membrane protein-like protein CG5021 isoform X1 [Ctenocephalides felis]